MNYTLVTTPENIELTYRLAGAGSRIAAAVIDLAVIAASLLLLTGVTYFAVGYGLNDLLNLSGWFIAFIIIAYFVIYFGYYIACELLMNGQSLGKRLFGLRVIRENGMPVGFTQSLVRNLIRYFIDFTGIGVVTIMFSKKCKRLGDMAASTIVVAEDSKSVKLVSTSLVSASLSADDLVNGTAGGGADFIADGFSADERYLIKEFRQRRGSFPDNGAAIEAKFDAYFGKKNRP
jgi:uncharacterized RDD family membrane protein YckC